MNEEYAVIGRQMNIVNLSWKMPNSVLQSRVEETAYHQFTNRISHAEKMHLVGLLHILQYLKWLVVDRNAICHCKAFELEQWQW